MPHVLGVNDDGAGFGVKGENATPPSFLHLHEAGVVGTSQGGAGVFGTSGNITNMAVFGSAGIGVQGACPDGTGVSGHSSSGHGVTGVSQTGIGVHGLGGQFAGKFDGVVQVNGTGDTDALNASTPSPNHAALSGTNNGGGIGLWAVSDSKTGNVGGVGVYARGATYAAQFDGNIKVNGSFVSTSGRAIDASCSDPNNDCIAGTSSATTHAGVSANNSGAGYGLWASSINGCAIYGKSTNVAALFDGKVQVNGTLTATQDIVLGSDCAEDFDIASAAEIEPGTVMVLNEDGALQPSQDAYDKKVAGVISGAGDYQPGLVLGRRDSSEGRMPLALVGKVYCKVDAQHGPVKVGDLLTTSSTPGHAMRAADPLKAFGTVIGKALRPLTSGKGLVPILIALQ